MVKANQCSDVLDSNTTSSLSQLLQLGPHLCIRLDSLLNSKLEEWKRNLMDGFSSSVMALNALQ